jgi:hypothetical protein
VGDVEANIEFDADAVRLTRLDVDKIFAVFGLVDEHLAK